MQPRSTSRSRNCLLVLVRCIHYAPSPEPVFPRRPSRFRFRAKPQTSGRPRRRPERSFRMSSTSPISAIFPSAPPPSVTTATTTSLPTTHSMPSPSARRSTRTSLPGLKPFPTTGFSDQDQLSHDLLVRVLQQRIADFGLKEYEMPINQQNGIHTEPRGSTAFGPLRLRQALRGLHCAASPNPPRAEPDHRSPSRRHEGQAHARPIPLREAPRPVSGHH